MKVKRQHAKIDRLREELGKAVPKLCGYFRILVKQGKSYKNQMSSRTSLGIRLPSLSK